MIPLANVKSGVFIAIPIPEVWITWTFTKPCKISFEYFIT